MSFEVKECLEIKVIKELFTEYSRIKGAESCFVSFDKEVNDLLGFYKDGSILVGYDSEEAVACIAVRKISEETCEAKRLFIKPEYRGKGYATALRDFYKRNMAAGTYVSWLAFDGDKIVGTSGMSYAEKPPYFTCPSGKLGILSSMYTDPDYRRKGIATELLDRVVKEAKAYGCGTIYITASNMGVKLYEAYGFKHNGDFMQLNF